MLAPVMISFPARAASPYENWASPTASRISGSWVTISARERVQLPRNVRMQSAAGAADEYSK